MKLDHYVFSFSYIFVWELPAKSGHINLARFHHPVSSPNLKCLPPPPSNLSDGDMGNFSRFMGLLLGARTPVTLCLNLSKYQESTARLVFGKALSYLKIRSKSYDGWSFEKNPKKHQN